MLPSGSFVLVSYYSHTSKRYEYLNLYSDDAAAAAAADDE